MSDPVRPFPDYSFVRLRTQKTDDKGRVVVAGVKGRIIQVHPLQAGKEPAYTIEVMIVDDRGTASDRYLFDARHSELEAAGLFAAEPILEPELTEIWNNFNRDFAFRPSTHEQDFPGIEEPTPSITYRLKEFGSMDPDEADAWAFDLMKACQPKGKRIIALDWQHFCWWLDVHLPDALEDFGRHTPLLPNGDYSIFLSNELESGIFGHPWERSLCVFGESFVKEARRRPPPFVEGVLREDGGRPKV